MKGQISAPVFSFLIPIMQWFECPICKKGVRDTRSLIGILITAFGLATINGTLISIVGLQFASEKTVLKVVYIAMVYTAVASLYWTWWQFDNLICSCNEKKEG